MPSLQADLDLQIEDALRNLGQLDDVLQKTADDFSSSLDLAIQIAVDTAERAGLTIPVDADTEPLQQTLAATLAGESSVVPVEADTSEIQPAVEEAITQSATDVEVGADTTQAEGTIQALRDEQTAEPVQVAVEVDTTEADDSLASLRDEASQAGDSLAPLNEQTKQLGTNSGITSDSTSLLSGGIGAFSARAVTGTLAAAGLGIGIHALFTEGTNALSAQQRYNTVLGDFGSIVNRIKVGSLNSDLGELGLKLGTTRSELQNSSANLFQFARTAGAGGQEAATFTQRIIALAARAVALNPALGSVSDVADSMALRLQRGGRSAQSFSLSLTAAEINARALKDTGKATASELTTYEKAAAAAAIATERYGGVLKSDVEEGSKNAIIQQRSLNAQLRENVETLGRPLVSPFLTVLQAAVPVASALGQILATLAGSVLPPLATVLVLVAAPLQLVADLLQLIPGPLLTVVAGFLAFQKVLSAATTQKLLERFSVGLAEGIKDNAAIAAAALIAVATAIDVIGQRSAPTTTQLLSLAASGAALGFQLGGVEGAAIGAGIGLGVGLVKGLFAAGESADETRARLAKLGSELDKLGDNQAAKKFIDSFLNAALDGKVKSFEDELEKLAESSPAAAQRVVRGLQQIATKAGDPIPTKELDKYQAAVERGAKSHQKYAENQKEADATNRQFEGSTTDVTAALDAQAQAEKDAADQIKSLSDTAKSSLGSISSLFDDARSHADDLAQSVASSVPTVSSSFDSLQSAAERFGVTLTPELLLSGLQGSVTNLLSFFDNVQVVMDAGFTTLGRFLAQKGPEAGGQIAQSIADGIRNGDPAIATELDNTAQLLEQGGKVAADRFGNAFTPDTLLKSFEDSLTATANFTENLRVLMDNGLTSLAGLLIQKGPEVGGSLAQQLADGIRNGDPAVATALNDKAKLLETSATVYADVVRNQWGPKILQAQNDALAALAPAARRSLGLVASSLSESDVATINAVGAFGGDIVTAFGNSLSGNGSTTGMPGASAAAIDAATGKILDGTPAAQQQGTQSGEDVTSGWTTGLSGIPGAAGSAVDAAGNPISQSGAALASQAGPAFGAGLVVGEAFSAGLITGMAFLIGDIIATATTLVQAAERAARDEARAKSPSQLFADLGRDLGSGLVVGLEARQSAATVAGAALTQAAALGARQVALGASAAARHAVSTAETPIVALPTQRAGGRSGDAPLVGTLVVQPRDLDESRLAMELARKLDTEQFLIGADPTTNEGALV